MEKLRNDVVQLFLGGASLRGIAKRLGVSRKQVTRIVREHQRGRERGVVHPDLPRAPRRKASILDPYEPFIREVLARYPDITAVRLLEELESQGFTGRYTIVRQRLKKLQPSPGAEPVVRFETDKGLQAQMDYSPFDIDFTSEGRRRVRAFSYILAHSRRQYVRFVESEDFTTTIREHVRAFRYLEGAGQVCLYDNMKVVVSRFDGEEPIYNPRFLAFATHYDYRPWACKRRRPQTKGKVERPFDYVHKNLLNGRSFATLEDLNRFIREVWLPTTADVRTHRETKCRPIDLWREEQPFLRPLPAQPYDTAEVVYRVVDVEGCVSYRGNSYSVPWQYIGELLPVRITASEVFVYGKDISLCARHRLLPRSVRSQRVICPEHRPRHNERQSREALLERYKNLSSRCALFLERLLERRRYGKHEAVRILGLLGLYRRQDLIEALERALRYGAYGFSSIERILGLQAQPRPPLEALAEESRDHLRELIDGERIEPRPTSEYQHLLGDAEKTDHGEEESEAR